MVEESQAARVLMIEDDVVTQRVLQRHLEELGYQPLVAADGQAGLEMADRDRPDAILLDVQLPGVDGLEVCRRLRSRPGTTGVPILILTHISDVGTRIAGFEAGADDYLTKPFEARELAARLQAHLALAEHRRKRATLEGVCGTLRMIAHEFNNPLQEVVGGIHLASDPSVTNAQRAEGFEMAREGVAQLADIARRLQQLSEPIFKSTPMGRMLDVEASTQAGR